MAGRLAQSFTDFIIAFRYPIIAFNIALVVLATAGMPPKFSTDYRMFFSEGNELLANFEQLESTYTKNDNIHYLFEAKSGNVFDPDILKAVGTFTEQGWKLPYAIRVDSITNFQNTIVRGDDVEVEDLIPNPDNVTPAQAQNAETLLFEGWGEPRLINRLISDRKHVTGVNITLQLPDPAPKPGQKVLLTPAEEQARAPADLPARNNIAVVLTKAEIAARDEHFRAAGGIATTNARELLEKLRVYPLNDVDCSAALPLAQALLGGANTQVNTPANTSITCDTALATARLLLRATTPSLSVNTPYGSAGGELNCHTIQTYTDTLHQQSQDQGSTSNQAPATLLNTLSCDEQTLATAEQLLAVYGPTYQDVINFRLVGITPFNQSFTEASQKDMGNLFPLAFLLMFVLLLVLLRNVFATILTFVVIGFSISFGLGGAAWIGIPLSPPASASIMIILTLAIAHCVHLFIAILYGMRRGEVLRQAVRESLRINAFPILLTSITTLIGFLCLNTSDAPPFADLGNIVAIGIVGSLFFSLTLLPAMVLVGGEISDFIWKHLSRLPSALRWIPWVLFRSGLIFVLPLPIGHLQATDFGRQSTTDPRQRTADIMDRFANFVVARKRALLIIMLLIILPLLALVPSNTLDDVFMKYFAKSMQIRQDAEFVLDNYTGFDGIVYSLEAGDDEYAITNPEFLQKVEAFAEFWRTRKDAQGNLDTVYVTAFTDTMKKLNQDFVGYGDPNDYRLPESKEIATGLLTLYQMSLPAGLDLNNELNQNQSSIRFTVIFQRVTSSEIADRAEIGAQWLRANWPTQAQLANVQQLNSDAQTAALDALIPPPNGTSMMFADISARNIRSMVWGSVGALVLISIILMFALRSLKLGLISLIPNLVPAGMGFGIWALTGQHVTVALSVVLGMTLGIVVDDTVHFLNAYLRAKREQGKNSDDAIRYAFSHVGKALWVTSLVLIVGFGVLTFSAFSPNADMGLLTAITIGMALVADFLLLPPLLMLIDRKRQPAT